MWEILGIPFWQVIQHEALHCLFSLLFLLAIYCVSQGICWLSGWHYPAITSTNGFLLLGFLVCAVLVSHYLGDEVWYIKPLWCR